MTGKIDCYIDIASFYSYIAFVDLLHNLDKLVANGVKVEFHPVLIAGINSLSGNQPPWMLPAKALYLDADSRRAAKRVGRPNIALPPAFQSMNITISPLRALHYIKANYSSAVFVSTVHAMFRSFWTPPHVNLTEDDKLAEVLLAATADEDGGGVGAKLFSDEDVKRIMEGRALMKDSVKRLTQQAVDKGAFGAPWLVATNGRGEEDVFFGSDRFAHVYQHLGIHYRDVEVLVPPKL